MFRAFTCFLRLVAITTTAFLLFIRQTEGQSLSVTPFLSDHRDIGTTWSDRNLKSSKSAKYDKFSKTVSKKNAKYSKKKSKKSSFEEEVGSEEISFYTGYNKGDFITPAPLPGDPTFEDIDFETSLFGASNYSIPESCDEFCIFETARCPADIRIPFKSSDILPPTSEVTYSPSSSPTNAPIRPNFICSDKTMKAVKYAANVGSLIAGLGNAGGAVAVGVFLGSLAYDLGCDKPGEDSVAQISVEDVRNISKEIGIDMAVQNELARAQSFSNEIAVYGDFGGIPMSRVISFASTFNAMENVVAGLGLKGIHAMVMFGSIKLALLNLVSEHIATNDQSLQGCCELLNLKYKSFVKQLSNNFAQMQIVLKDYEQEVRNKISVRQSRDNHPNQGCKTNCVDCGYRVWCCYPWEGETRMRDTTPITLHDVCVTEYTKGNRPKNHNAMYWMNRKVNVVFSKVRRKMYTPEILQMEKDIKNLVEENKSLRCAIP